MKDPIFWLAISISLVGVSQVINTINDNMDVKRIKRLEQRCDSLQIQIDKCYTDFKTRTK